METGAIAFQVGLDEHGAKPPSQFPHRFAVLTWIDRDGDGSNPWSLLRECIPVLANRMEADCVLAEYWKRQKRLFRKPTITKNTECAWGELMKHDSDQLHQHVDFPDRIRFERHGQVVLLAETE